MPSPSEMERERQWSGDDCPPIKMLPRTTNDDAITIVEHWVKGVCGTQGLHDALERVLELAKTEAHRQTERDYD